MFATIISIHQAWCHQEEGGEAKPEARSSALEWTWRVSFYGDVWMKSTLGWKIVCIYIYYTNENYIGVSIYIYISLSLFSYIRIVFCIVYNLCVFIGKWNFLLIVSYRSYNSSDPSLLNTPWDGTSISCSARRAANPKGTRNLLICEDKSQGKHMFTTKWLVMTSVPVNSVLNTSKFIHVLKDKLLCRWFCP